MMTRGHYCEDSLVSTIPMGLNYLPASEGSKHCRPTSLSSIQASDHNEYKF